MIHQLSFIEPDASTHAPATIPDLPVNPTSIVVSVSGGLDSAACAIWARQRWPDRPLILWHAHLAEMDWPQTDDQLCALATALGNCHLISVQAVYRLNGEITTSGANGTTLRRLHVVRDGAQWFGPAEDDDPNAILTLLDFARKARNGQPPTSKLRWCTSYFKVRACDTWLRAHRAQLGERPVLLTGERHAESPSRAKLPQAECRFGTKGWDVHWHRPILDWPWHQVVRASIAADVPIHPGYELQGETMPTMLNPHRDERGRARLSCVACIFTHQHHIATALLSAPELVGELVRLVQQYEQETGYSWQQRGPLLRTAAERT